MEFSELRGVKQTMDTYNLIFVSDTKSTMITKKEVCPSPSKITIKTVRSDSQDGPEMSHSLQLGCEIEVAHPTNESMKRRHSDVCGVGSSGNAEEDISKTSKRVRVEIQETLDSDRFKDVNNDNEIEVTSAGDSSFRELFFDAVENLVDNIDNDHVDYPFINTFPDLDVEADDGDREQETPDLINTSTTTIKAPDFSDIPSQGTSELDLIVYSDRTSSEFVPGPGFRNIHDDPPPTFWDIES